MNRKVLVVGGAILLSLVSCCGVCMVAGVVADPNTAAEGNTASGELDGRYECWMRSSYMMNRMQMTTQLASITFSLDGRTYTSKAGSGSITQNGDALQFSGGDMDGWVGSVVDGPAIVFGKNPRAQHSGAVNNGDMKCDRAK